mmetsp:Transcript_15701/g.28651  ORF Transcript_15701/g.28651 Transcript_15701/m.28651 type:complete len:560 (+) Transcript_15701:324-2003(+)
MQESMAFENRVSRLMQQLDTTSPDLDEVARLLAALQESLTYLPQYKQKVAEISTQSLSLLLEFADKNLHDTRKLQSLAKLLAPLNAADLLGKKLIFRAQISFQMREMLELGFKDLLSRLEDHLIREATIYAEVFDDPVPQAQELIKETVDPFAMSMSFLQLPVSEQIEVFEHDFLTFLLKVNRFSRSIVPFDNFVFRLADGFEHREVTLLKPLATIESRSWKSSILKLFSGVSESWRRCVVLTFAVKAPQWAKSIEPLITDLLNYSGGIVRDLTTTLSAMDLDFPAGATSAPLEWAKTEQALEQFHAALKVFCDLKALDSKCRKDLLETTSAGRFSNDRWALKELQDSLSSKSSSHPLSSLRRALQEGACLWPAAQTRAEALMKIAREGVLKTILRPISAALANYSALEVWSRNEKPQFSLSRTESAAAIGEHMLFLLSQLASEENPLYRTAYEAEFYTAPPDKLPHAVGTHFWMVVVTSLVLRILTAKLMQIKAFGAEGLQQLATDLRYLLNLLRTFGVTLGSGASYTESLSLLLNTLEGSEVSTDSLSRAVMSKRLK